MKILIVLGHPDQGSLNHAIAHAVRDDLRSAGHDVIFHDLYAEKFDPVLAAVEIPASGIVPAQIGVYCEELRSVDGIVIVHPNWWGQPPAILKGWVDRVFRPEVAYRFEEGDGGEGVPIGLLNAGAAVVINTSNTPAERERTAFGDPLEALWRMCIFDLCGVSKFYRMIFSVVVTSSDEQRQKWINDAKRLCRAAFSSRPPSCDGVEKQTQYELSSGKRVMVEDASGVEGLLIRSGASHCLRVYDRNDDFIDYDIYHDDLAVSIEDDSLASFYSDGQNHWVDHSPQVLGLKKVKKVKKEENNE